MCGVETDEKWRDLVGQARNASHSLEEKVKLVYSSSQGLPRQCARRERGTVRGGFFVLREICRFRLRARRLRVRALLPPGRESG